MRAPTRHPVGQFMVALVVSIQINQLLSRIGTTLDCDALRMINLDAPQMALQGDTIRLTCSFSLTSEPARGSRQTETADGTSYVATSEPVSDNIDKRQSSSHKRFASAQRSRGPPWAGGAEDSLVGEQFARERQPRRWRRSPKDESDSGPELLYAIKWYKDDREFYQFVSKDWPHKRALPLAGLNIDVDKSDNQTVVLKSVSLKTSGLFRCEVSTDAPSFVTKSIERKIFIYSLPAEGPVIQTSLPRTKPNHLNLHLGDQLEFRCFSRESKPNTELDWIINETWNLTAKNPTGANGSPLFNVTKRNFVRLPAFAMNPERSPSQSATKTSARSHPVIASPLQQRPPNNETIYELIDERGRTLVRPMDSTLPSPTASISSGSLDQFLESSMSILNFSVDTNLAQHLQMHAQRGGSSRAQHKNAPPMQKATTSGDSSANNNRTPPETSFRTKKISAERRRLNSVGQPDNDKLQLDIRCVARVMHVTMLDEIKLRVVNRTRPSNARASPMIETQRQERRIQSNSAAIYAVSSSWVYPASCLPWITTLGLRLSVLHVY